MTAINHALTGVVIGLTIANPIVAVSLAFVSHYALDAIPHFGPGQVSGLGSKFFRNFLICDALLCIALVVTLGVSHPTHWVVAVICAFVATSPDLMWAPKFFAEQKDKHSKQPTYLLARIHSKVQWFERPSGLIVEVFWAMAAVICLKILLKN